jgi:hypothetical protein
MQLLESRQIRCSISVKGYCLNNAVVDNFFSTLKQGLNFDDDCEVLLSSE